MAIADIKQLKTVPPQAQVQALLMAGGAANTVPRGGFFDPVNAPAWCVFLGLWRASHLARAVVPPPRLRSK